MKRVLIFLLLLFVLLDVTQVHATPQKEFRGFRPVTKYVYKKVKVRKKHYLGVFYITHYCPCSRCCGPYGGRVTASGTRPKAGRTVGVNRRLIRFKTRLKVGNNWNYVAEDTGGGIGWRHLDIFCSSHQAALKAGVGHKKVWSWEWRTVRKKAPYIVYIPIYEEVEDE